MMHKRYTHADIEKKWQARWRDAHVYAMTSSTQIDNALYCLVEFPYPSGNLHVGHWYAFAVTDIYVRFMRMTGKNVLFPIGFDAFGLPAENAAIKRGLNPRIWTEDNMAHMRTQIASMGASFDTSREVVTCHSEYYRWTQWLFLQLFAAGLVRRRTTTANWCPSCKTVLANEQVVGGACERCGAVVEKKEMPQWQIEITRYADRLIDDLDTLDWPAEIKASQKNWIGRSEGAEIDFRIRRRGDQSDVSTVTVFTTRPDTLYGATYLVLAPESAIVTQLAPFLTNNEAVTLYSAQTKAKSDIERQAEGKEKTGVRLEGITAINPATGEEIPVFIADYVLAHYGTGAIMAVPAHDARDFAFATKYGLPIKQVIAPYVRLVGKSAPISDNAICRFKASTAIIRHWNDDNKYLFIRFVNGLWGLVGGSLQDNESYEDALYREMEEETIYKKFTIEKTLFAPAYSRGYKERKKREEECCETIYVARVVDDVRSDHIADEEGIEEWAWLTPQEAQHKEMLSHHRFYFDWYLSKQDFYAGDGCITNTGTLFDGMPSEEAKKAITEHVGGRMTRTYKLRDWGVSRQRYWGVPIPLVECATCGWQAVPDAHLPVTLPEIDDYLPREDGKSPLAKHAEWVQTTCPHCGGAAQRETDTMDTFVCSSWYFLRYCDPHNDKTFADSEKLATWMPVDFYSGGAEHTTMHLLYSRFWHKALFDLGLVPTAEPYKMRTNRGLILGPDGNKMSKSKGNVIDPDDLVRDLGADTLRLYLAFIGPYNETGNYPWNPQSIIGVRRFVERIWRMQDKVSDNVVVEGCSMDRVLHKTLAQVTESLETRKINTGVAGLMHCLNVMERSDMLMRSQWQFFLVMLAPYAPHITAELWEASGAPGDVHAQRWPVIDATLLQSDTVTLPVQINGKVRTTITVPTDADDAFVTKTALEDSKIARHVADASIKKTIIVRGRVINIVL